MKHRYLWPRGEQLPHTKLTANVVREIRAAQVKRNELRQYIAENLSDEALSVKFGVHKRTIEKVLAWETHVHVK